MPQRHLIPVFHKDSLLFEGVQLLCWVINQGTEFILLLPAHLLFKNPSDFLLNNP